MSFGRPRTLVSRFVTGAVFAAFAAFGFNSIASAQSTIVVWANTGEHKVTRDELRVARDGRNVVNSAWDGTTIKMFGGRKEVVNFAAILEAPSGAANVSVSFDTLTGPNGVVISSTPTTGDGVFGWIDRRIELFYIRYLQIRGLSLVSYGTYDERHVPEKLRRPYDNWGIGTGGWLDRPNHDKFYPEIAIPQ